jgi:transcription antitermination factor NusG
MSENIGDLNANWNINQEIEIIDGPFNGFKGVIYFINREKMMIDPRFAGCRRGQPKLKPNDFYRRTGTRPAGYRA